MLHLDVLNSEFWQHIASNTSSYYIMFTNCTSPLVKVETYNKFLRIFFKNKNLHDSLNTVCDEKQFLYLNNKALNFNPQKSTQFPRLAKYSKIKFCHKYYCQKKNVKKKKCGW